MFETIKIGITQKNGLKPFLLHVMDSGFKVTLNAVIGDDTVLSKEWQVT